MITLLFNLFFLYSLISVSRYFHFFKKGSEKSERHVISGRNNDYNKY